MRNFFNEHRLPHTARLRKRFLAFVIDISLAGLIGLLISIYYGMATATHIIPFTRPDLGQNFYQLIINYADLRFIILFTMIVVLFRDILEERSFGKKVLGLSVINKATDKSHSLRMLIFRIFYTGFIVFLLALSLISPESFLTIITIVLLLDLVLINTQPNHRNMGDFINNTVVVENRENQNHENYRLIDIRFKNRQK